MAAQYANGALRFASPQLASLHFSRYSMPFKVSHMPVRACPPACSPAAIRAVALNSAAYAFYKKGDEATAQRHFKNYLDVAAAAGEQVVGAKPTNQPKNVAENQKCDRNQKCGQALPNMWPKPTCGGQNVANVGWLQPGSE
jgi:hypothetical protein